MFEILKEHTTSTLHYWEEDGRKYLEFQGIYNDIPFEICEWEEKPKRIKSLLFKGISVNLIDEEEPYV